MKKLRRPAEERKQIMNCAVILASMCVTLGKVGQELMKLDPNLWYSRYLFYIDRITTAVEVLEILWEQNHEELEQMSVEMPSSMIAVRSDPEKSLEEVFKEMLSRISEDTNMGLTPHSIDDLPF